MRIDILTLFPDCFTPLFCSIPKRAQDAGLVQVNTHDLRQWGKGVHRQVDDGPYGGGPGMVMACPPLEDAFASLGEGHVIYLSPQGRPLDQARVMELAQMPRLILLCGHYEGIDERAIELFVDEEICIGDFVVSGGEVPAMMLADAVIRVLPGVISEQSVQQDSFYDGLLDHPHYTRPAEFQGKRVPDVLVSGDHKKIDKWRHEAARERTRLRRPELFLSWQKRQDLESPPRRARHGQERINRPQEPET